MTSDRLVSKVEVQNFFPWSFSSCYSLLFVISSLLFLWLFSCVNAWGGIIFIDVAHICDWWLWCYSHCCSSPLFCYTCCLPPFHFLMVSVVVIMVLLLLWLVVAHHQILDLIILWSWSSSWFSYCCSQQLFVLTLVIFMILWCWSSLWFSRCYYHQLFTISLFILMILWSCSLLWFFHCCG